jgi:hypothetical protein
MKQTAVEWLVSKTELNYYSDSDTLLAIQQALEMEKQQIIEACNYGDFEELGEQYYNKTYKPSA